MVVLGIDPGIASTGWAVLEANGNSISLKGCDVIKTPAGETLGNRLKQLNDELDCIINRFNPGCAVIEELFFAKNVKTAITVGHARGVILMACARKGLEIIEFTPLQIKQALTGFGAAKKPQIDYMVKQILKIKEHNYTDDTVDAIAAGICYINTNKNMK